MKPSTILSSSPTDSSVFNPIDLEASLGRIEDLNSNERRQVVDQASGSASTRSSFYSVKERMTIEDEGAAINPRSGITRTSSRTPFRREATNIANSESQDSLPQPYPISETDAEISERMRLTGTVDWSSGLAIGNAAPKSTPSVENDDVMGENADQQSMMEVTVDDFVLSAEEATSLTDLDAMTIQEDPNGFWDTPVHVVTKLSVDKDDANIMNGCSVPFSVTFSSQDNAYMMDQEDGIIVTDADADASPIRSVDMEW